MPKVTTIQPNTRNKKKKLRVAAYCRVSTDSEAQLESLETQMAHYEKYINDHADWIYAGLYYDEGISGVKMTKREGLLQLLADCEERKIDFIVTKSISRFSRNTADCLALVRKLLDLNIPIFFEKENINTSAMDSELYITLYSSLAEDESHSNSMNVKWSTQKRFQNGTYKLSSPPYGYKWNGEEMVVDPEQAEVVRMIFTETLVGNGSTSIAKKLNELGIPAAKGQHWSESSIQGILVNEKYVGDVTFQKTYTDDRFTRHANRGERDQYMMLDHHEPIISREDFEAVAAIIAQRSEEKRIEKGSDKYQNRYVFSGKIVCGECGNTFKRRIHKNGDCCYVAWCCKTHLADTQKCSMQYIRDDLIQLAFATMINKLIFAHRWLLRPYLTELRKTTTDYGLRRISELQSLLFKNTEQRETLTGLRTQGYIDHIIFSKENNALMTQAQEYREEIAMLNRTMTGDTSKVNETMALLRYAENTEMLTTFDDKLFGKFVNRIMVFKRNEIGFELKCGLTLKERLD